MPDHFMTCKTRDVVVHLYSGIHDYGVVGYRTEMYPVDIPQPRPFTIVPRTDLPPAVVLFNRAVRDVVYGFITRDDLEEQLLDRYQPVRLGRV